MPLLLIILLGLLLPRVALVLCWCGGVFNDVWRTPLWPLLGFLLMPYTTLAYGFAHALGPGLEGLWVGVLILGVILDLGSNGGSATRQRRRRR
jgi:hypothetical protein